MRALIAALALALATTAAQAQDVADHLQCYKVTNVNLKKLKGVVDLDALGIGLAPGCKLTRATHYCVPAQAELQAGTLFDGHELLAPEPFEAATAGEARICYKVACPKAAIGVPDQVAQDPFGVHEFKKLRAQLVCAPATPPAASFFQIVTPEIEVLPFQEIAWCYYFRTSNNVTAAIKRFTSEMSPVIRQAILYTTEDEQGEPVDKLPPGTLSAANCGFANSQVTPHWVYAAHAPSEELTLPANDGTGKPLAIEVGPHSAGFLLMHMINSSDEPVTAQVTIEAAALDPGAEYTETATYTTYNPSLSIPPLTNGAIETQSCAVPPGAMFWRLTTDAHMQAVKTEVHDGATLLFESTDWEEPGAQEWPSAPFGTFTTNQLTYSCTYDNPTNRTILTGDSFATDEKCMAVGYFFPTDGPKFCYGSFGPL